MSDANYDPKADDHDPSRDHDAAVKNAHEESMECALCAHGEAAHEKGLCFMCGCNRYVAKPERFKLTNRQRDALRYMSTRAGTVPYSTIGYDITKALVKKGLAEIVWHDVELRSGRKVRRRFIRWCGKYTRNMARHLHEELLKALGRG